MEIDLNALQELPAEEQAAGGACGPHTCHATCTFTCFNTNPD